MKQINISKAAACLFAMAGLTFSGMEAAQFTVGKESRLARLEQSATQGRRFDGGKIFSAADMRLDADRSNPLRGIRRVAVKDPDTSYSNLPQFGYLQAPDGSIWFYTSKYETEEREFFVDKDLSYTEEVTVGFTFTFYDSSMREVGQISDTIEYGPGETRAVDVSPDPLLTTRYFNGDDNIEVMVYMAMNTEEYVNRYRYKVYSIGGETDSEGNSKSILGFDGLIIDSPKASDQVGVEDYYFTFRSDAMSVDMDADYDNYIDFLNSMVYRMTVCRMAEDYSAFEEVLTKDIYCARIPGDTTVGSYIISKSQGGKMYYVFSQYEKPYFVDPTGLASDESATPDNSLTIEVVRLDGQTPARVSFTSIPVQEYPVEGQLIYTYMSIGSVAEDFDIDMKVNGTPDSPAFIVAIEVQNAAEYEDFLLSGYYIYNTEGQIIKELSPDSKGAVIFLDGDNEPQTMFAVLRPDGGYDFNFGSLYSGKTEFTIDQDNGGDPLTASCDRVKQKDGSYKYAFEMRYYDIDDEENEYIRVAWYNGDGTFDRIDRINMGKNVMAGAVNMAASVLQPDLFDTDDAMEYAVMVKRSNGESLDPSLGIATEFMVVDDSGKPYAHFTQNDGKGLPYSFTISFGEPKRLMMIYSDYYRYNIDVYELPFMSLPGLDENGVGEIAAPAAGSIRFDGLTVAADGAALEIFNMLGVKVAEGAGAVGVSALPSGNYIVVATDAAGSRSALKIVK